MKITGFANNMPGESLSLSRTEEIETPPAEGKVKAVSAAAPANNSLMGSLASEIKQGLARVFDKVKFAHVPPHPNNDGEFPPDPYDRDRRKKAVAKYKKVLNPDQKSGSKFNKAA